MGPRGRCSTPSLQLLALLQCLGVLLSQGSLVLARVVSTKWGKVEGGLANGIEFYRGIPYAAPPVGDLRWRAPTPAEPWTGTRNATDYGNECIQGLPPPGGPSGGGPPGGGPPGGGPPASEDCLYLNIYAQEGAKKLPVMVWIHGGGFQAGSGSDSQWDGTVWIPQLARPVVLVTINYRLNVFGFLGSKELQAEQSLNAGLLDQRMAFKWIRMNVEAFGGDPKSITGFGESAGAVSLGCHVLFRSGTQRIFDKAILESGSYPSLFTQDLHSVKTAQVNFDYVAAEVGCSKETGVLECLRQKNASDIAAASPLSPSFGKLVFSPILARPFFTGLPATAVQLGLQSFVPIIAGTNGNEGRFFYDMSGGNVTDEQQLEAFIAEYLPVLDASDRAATYALYDPVKFFFSSYARAAQEIIGDTKFVCNSEYLAAGSVKRQRKAFRFEFNFTIDGQQATHGSEIPYVWPSAGSGLSVSNDIFLSAWPRFAYQGTPTGNAAQWPNFSKGKQILLESNITSSIVVAPDIHQRRCEFWRVMEKKYFKALTE